MNERANQSMTEAYGSFSEAYASALESILIPMAEEVLRLANLKGAERLLDLATGTGVIARTISGKGDLPPIAIFGVDIAMGMLVEARRLSAGEIFFVAADALRLPFSEDHFDVVTCGFSLSHFTDVQGALKEVRRVLRSRGRMIVSAWGSEKENPAYSAAAEVREKYLRELEDPFAGTFDEGTWADVERGCGVFNRAGFENVRVETIPIRGEYRHPAEAMERVFAWPLTRYRIARLEPEQRRRLKEETLAAILEIDDFKWWQEIHYYHAV